MAIQDTIKGWPWYGQAGLFAVIAAAIFFGGSKLMIAPKQEEIAKLEKERQGLVQEINKGETLKSRFIEFESELKRLESQLESLKKILPESEKVDELYSRIQQEATELGLNITQVKPGKHIPQDYYEEWPISMTMVGNYHVLAKFFERVGKLYRIINVNDVQIKANSQRGKAANPNSITATCIATTFIYREGPPPTTTKSKKRK